MPLARHGSCERRSSERLLFFGCIGAEGFSRGPGEERPLSGNSDRWQRALSRSRVPRPRPVLVQNEGAAVQSGLQALPPAAEGAAGWGKKTPPLASPHPSGWEPGTDLELLAPQPPAPAEPNEPRLGRTAIVVPLPFAPPCCRFAPGPTSSPLATPTSICACASSCRAAS